MNQLWSVIKFEFAAFARNKVFVVMTIILAAIALLGPAAPAIIDQVNFGGFGAERTIAIVDHTDIFPDEIIQAFIVPPATRFNTLEQAIAAVEDGDHHYALVLTQDGFVLHVTAMGIGAANIQGQVSHMFQNTLRAAMLDAHGLSPEEIQQVMTFTPASDIVTIGDEYATIDSFVENIIYANVMSFVLYFALLIGGGHLLTTVVREKSTKTMELLVTSCPPRTMINGKVIGTGAAIMTQILTMAVAALAGMRLTPAIFNPGEDVFSINISPEILIFLVVFFLLGFIMYSYIYAALASTTSRMEDAQSLSQLPQLLIMAGFFVNIFGMQNPGATWVQVVSHIPFTGPFVMFMRICMGTAATWEIYVAILVQAVTIGIIAYLAAKIYRMGTLMYGAKPSFKTLMEAFK